MKHLKKFNNIINESKQEDIVHYEVVIEEDGPFLRVSTDEGSYYHKLMDEKSFLNRDKSRETSLIRRVLSTRGGSIGPR